MRLYIHLPFCLSRCAYCDFNSRVAGFRVRRDYVLALLRELDTWACILGEKERLLESIYIGGGTPSLMSGGDISGLLGEVTARFRVHGGTEVTVEVNPATWNREDFAIACAGGVNRISIGVQALRDRDLKLLGRAHDAREAKDAVTHAMGSDAASVSVDLLYGLPGMSADVLRECLNEVLEMGPHHLSLYALTLEERTPLYDAVAGGEIALPGEDEVAEEFLAGAGLLHERGFEHYEISNFCLPGHHSRHNLACWTREEYLGIGAGAHSFLGSLRFRNTASVLAYKSMVGAGLLPVSDCELLAGQEEVSEEIMLGLRTDRGVRDDILGAGDAYLEDLEDEGLLVREGGRVRLTDRGMLVSNALITDLLPA
ncbi:MAG: radical SAM family heme chaperone HemW [Actinobacteria bacterium]|jgi:oxygen-independent coproporphyrinogen-3 oxidase|nr:MAG: radical SAM family heme chaperone HemW [Actinomycetota bacterium]